MLLVMRQGTCLQTRKKANEGATQEHCGGRIIIGVELSPVTVNVTRTRQHQKGRHHRLGQRRNVGERGPNGLR